MFDSLGEGLAARGDFGAAIRSYERSLELFPGNHDGAEVLAELRSRRKPAAPADPFFPLLAPNNPSPKRERGIPVRRRQLRCCGAFSDCPFFSVKSGSCPIAGCSPGSTIMMIVVRIRCCSSTAAARHRATVDLG
ncbi:MAG: tetratricopeptide repeat protein [Planctomycetes bacterium]|nr:tetratricopeptide repeat protein [Planctomycetota bacterium]